MARVKTARITRKKHKKVLKQAKGYYGAKHYRFRMAKQAVMKSGMYAYIGRKDKKSNFRKLWITRINAACRMNDISYSKFINGLSKAGVEINRKMLSEVAIDNPKLFASYVTIAKDALAGKNVKSVAEKANKEVAASPKEDTADISKLTVAELREMAEANGIEGASSMKKAELVEALSK